MVTEIWETMIPVSLWYGNWPLNAFTVQIVINLFKIPQETIWGIGKQGVPISDPWDKGISEMKPIFATSVLSGGMFHMVAQRGRTSWDIGIWSCWSTWNLQVLSGEEGAVFVLSQEKDSKKLMMEQVLWGWVQRSWCTLWAFSSDDR